MTADEMHEVFAEWNKGELDSYLIEITARHSRVQGHRRPAAGGQDPRHRRPERHRQMDGHFFAWNWAFPITLMAEAVYSRCVSALKDERVIAAKKLKGPRPENLRRPRQIHRRHPPRALCLEDHFLRAGLHADARRGQGIQVEPELRRHRADVARRLHHPQPVPGQDQGGLRRESEAHESAARQIFPEGDQGLPAFVAQCRGHGGQEGHSDAGVFHRAQLLRRVTAASVCRRTCCRRSAIISARTPTSASTSRAGEFFHTNWTGHGGDVSSGSYNA